MAKEATLNRYLNFGNPNQAKKLLSSKKNCMVSVKKA